MQLRQQHAAERGAISLARAAQELWRFATRLSHRIDGSAGEEEGAFQYEPSMGASTAALNSFNKSRRHLTSLVRSSPSEASFSHYLIANDEGLIIDPPISTPASCV